MSRLTKQIATVSLLLLLVGLLAAGCGRKHEYRCGYSAQQLPPFNEFVPISHK
jgi:hypothetical protein